MTVEPIFEGSVDIGRNVARVSFAGNFTPAAMELSALEIESLVGQLKPGFFVFADFGEVTAMDLDSFRPLTRIMDLLRDAGVSRVVHILPAPSRDIGINLLGTVHYRGRIRIMTVETRAEAERALV